MIRVLHVVTYMGRGGLETMLMNYYRHIDRTKVQFDFLVHRDFEADYDQEILSLGGKIYHVSRLIPWSKKYQEELKKFFNEHKEYKIIHVHQDCLSAVALKCAKECGVSVRIAHSHSSSAPKDIKYLIKKYYMKKIPKNATHLLACGKKAGDWMFGGKKYKIVHNAIDTKKFEPCEWKRLEIREQLGLENYFVIGHVGNFTVAKNHGFLLDIFDQILIKNPKSKLLLIGEGDRKAEIQKKVENLGIQDNVIFMGKRNDVYDLMKSIDIFVFPSLYEGLPVTMIEAQAAGLPCVISDQVSSECIVTKELVTIKRLKDTQMEWAQHILNQRMDSRKNHIEEIKDSGYDICVEARKLEQFYILCDEGR